MELPKLMTAQAAAKKLGIGPKLFKKEVLARRIRFISIGRRRKFIDEDIILYLNDQRERSKCRYTSGKTVHISHTTSVSKVKGISEVHL
ncbi:hypothetical protein [Telmatospirillum sp.]|uniref:hypothetical protein n=1 Tax=Telmatospirillum sp. TaxID=2079197 RepID=UPI002851640D|nr:hypothetical protein [Telmatospirillum sp.]MDR3436384.1 hypothetical protein [Telmatospirillum sp.]